MAETASQPPILIHLERTKSILDGVVVSRSDESREYVARIMLRSSLLCSCISSQTRGKPCVHLKTLLDGLETSELRQWVLDSQADPEA